MSERASESTVARYRPIPTAVYSLGDGGVEEHQEEAADNKSEQRGEEERPHPAEFDALAGRVEGVGGQSYDHTCSYENCLRDDDGRVEGDGHADRDAKRARPQREGDEVVRVPVL